MTDPPLHPACTPLVRLLGTWTGEGEGFYPTIQPFRYREESRFWHTGRPFLHYEQLTWNLATGAPSHTEVGFWRPRDNGLLEVVLAHGFGVAEIQEGTIEGSLIQLCSMRVAGTSTAKPIQEIARTLEVKTDVLVYEVSMAAVGEPLQGHLRAELVRA